MKICQASATKLVIYSLTASFLLSGCNLDGTAISVNREENLIQSPADDVTSESNDNIIYTALQDSAGTAWGGYGKDGFYFLQSSERPDGSSNLMYLDYESEKVFYLCTQVNCTHDSDACTSYVLPSNGGVSVTVVGDQLVLLFQNSAFVSSETTSNSRIVTMELDGSNKKSLAEFSSNQAVEKPMVTDGTCIYMRVTTQEDADNIRADLVQLNCQTGEEKIIRHMDTSCNERIWGAFDNSILLYRYENPLEGTNATPQLVSWDPKTDQEDVLYSWSLGSPYPILNGKELAYLGQDNYFHILNLSTGEDCALTQYTLPKESSVRVSASAITLMDGHLLIRELREDGTASYYTLEKSGKIGEFDKLFSIDSDKEIYLPLAKVDRSRYLIFAGYVDQSLAAFQQDGTSRLIRTPQRVFVLMEEDEYWGI